MTRSGHQVEDIERADRQMQQCQRHALAAVPVRRGWLRWDANGPGRWDGPGPCRRCQRWRRSASMSSSLVIEERPSTPSTLARSCSSSMVRSS